MNNVVVMFILVVLLSVLLSVTWDLYTYGDRQTLWEREHRGSTYIPGYKRSERKAEKIVNRKFHNGF